MMIIQNRCQFVSSSLEMYRHRVSLLVTDSLSSAILLTLHDCYGRAVTQVTSSCKRTGQDFGNRSVHRLVYMPKLISAVQPVQEAKTACYNWTVFEPVDCLFFSDDDSIYWQKTQLDFLWYVNKLNVTIVLTVFPYKVYIVYMYINTAVACNQSKP